MLLSFVGLLGGEGLPIVSTSNNDVKFPVLYGYGVDNGCDAAEFDQSDVVASVESVNCELPLFDVKRFVVLTSGLVD